LHFVDSLSKCDKAFLKLTNVTCSAFPFWGTATHIGVSQILAGATITASTPIAVTVLQVTCFSLPPITTCTQEISYTVCAASIVPTWVGGTFIFICRISHKWFCCDTKSLNHWWLKFLWCGGISVYKHAEYYITPQLYWILFVVWDAFQDVMGDRSAPILRWLGVTMLEIILLFLYFQYEWHWWRISSTYSVWTWGRK
jgi:hypothetical protein